MESSNFVCSLSCFFDDLGRGSVRMSGARLTRTSCCLVAFLLWSNGVMLLAVDALLGSLVGRLAVVLPGLAGPFRCLLLILARSVLLLCG